MEDLYAILGITSTASIRDIKRAYRKKIRLYHPDTNKSADAETLTKQINQAYEVLLRYHSDTEQPAQPEVSRWEYVQPQQTVKGARIHRRPGTTKVRITTSDGYFDVEFR